MVGSRFSAPPPPRLVLGRTSLTRARAHPCLTKERDSPLGETKWTAHAQGDFFYLACWTSTTTAHSSS